MKGTDNHKVCSRATGPLGHDSEIETFLRSRPEDADISGKVQMTTLVSACQWARLPLADERCG